MRIAFELNIVIQFNDDFFFLSIIRIIQIEKEQRVPHLEIRKNYKLLNKLIISYRGHMEEKTRLFRFFTILAYSICILILIIYIHFIANIIIIIIIINIIDVISIHVIIKTCNVDHIFFLIVSS